MVIPLCVRLQALHPCVYSHLRLLCKFGVNGEHLGQLWCIAVATYILIYDV